MSVTLSQLDKAFQERESKGEKTAYVVMHPEAYTQLLEAFAVCRQLYYRTNNYAKQIKAQRRARKNRR